MGILPRVESGWSFLLSHRFQLTSAKRTLEEIDFLFASNSPFVWKAEATFQRLTAENPKIARSGAEEKKTIGSHAVLGHDEEKRFA
jgi:hypothetical protein